MYKTKKGVCVTALNGVSVKFPQKGLVFLLGKSGSGKSMLLNLLGGLDKYYEGEIIIKAKLLLRVCLLRLLNRDILIPTEILMWDLFSGSIIFWKNFQ